MTLRAAVVVERETFTLDVEVSCAANETLAVVGPNAAGKTTLLRAIAGLEPTMRGTIELNGIQVHGLPAERRGVGFMFQDNALFPHMSALDNIAFGAPSRASAAQWLERVGLGHVAGTRPSELSGGQAQRVALARALARDPNVLLLDEPLASLDAATRTDVRGALVRHLKEFGGPRVFVSHDPVDVMILADRVVVLDAGRVVQLGTPDEVNARPRHAWVADLAGTNLFAGAASGTTIALDGGGTLQIAVPANGRVYAAVTPRAVGLYGTQPAGSPRNVWRGRVTHVEPLGDVARVQVAGAPSVTAEVTRAAAADLAIAPGAEVWVAVKATEIEVYSA